MANSILRNISTPQNQQQSSMQFNPEMVQQIKQFAQTVKGNPRDIVMNMIQQGVRSNEQLKQAMSMAQQFQGMFK